MTAPPRDAARRDVVVVERSPFARMAFIGQSSRLPAGLFLHDDLALGVACMRLVNPSTIFISRQVLMEAGPDTLQDLVGTMVSTPVRVVVLLGRNEPRDVGGRMAINVEWFLSTPFSPETMLLLAQGLTPQDDGAVRATSRISTPVANLLQPSAQQHATPALGMAASSGNAPLQSPSRSGASLAETLRRDRLMQTNVERLDHFEVLGVPPDAPRRELLSAYLSLVRRFHPDLAATLPDARLATEVRAIYRRITDAWTVLGNEEKRQAYRLHHLSMAQRSPGTQRSLAG
jgi:DNA-binding NarL/FixJ family response regulator